MRYEGDQPPTSSLSLERTAVAKDRPKPSLTPSTRSVKVQASLDADLYTRFAAGAAILGVSHSRFMQLAIEAQLREMGVVVVRRRSAGHVAPDDSVIDPGEAA